MESVDTWVCPEGERLHRTETDLRMRLVRYRARAHICNACRLKDGCTDSDSGRAIARAIDPWPHSEAGRFTEASRSRWSGPPPWLSLPRRGSIIGGATLPCSGRHCPCRPSWGSTWLWTSAPRLRDSPGHPSPAQYRQGGTAGYPLDRGSVLSRTANAAATGCHLPAVERSVGGSRLSRRASRSSWRMTTPWSEARCTCCSRRSPGSRSWPRPVTATPRSGTCAATSPTS
jgi:hypothetical protein